MKNQSLSAPSSVCLAVGTTRLHVLSALRGQSKLATNTMYLYLLRAWAFCVVMLVLPPTAAFSQTLNPVRVVEGSTVVSKADPAARITVPSTATYAGAVRFVLFGAADCEIHLFVDADAEKRIRRLYWVQFDAYLPQYPELRFTPHPAFTPTQLNGVPFYQRARFGKSTDPIKPGSEAEYVFALLRAKGYALPDETVNVTLKHFLDASMRKEILLILLEDMAPRGVTVAQLVQGGQVTPAWAPVAAKLLEQAPAAFTVTLSLPPTR